MVITDHHSAASDQYSTLPDHHSFYQYIYRSSLSSYARVAIVYLHVAIFFLRPMGHGSSHARSRSTRLRAMIESSENVHNIELSNWVGRGKLKACARVRACVLRIQDFLFIFFMQNFFLTCTSRQHYTVMYNSAFFVYFWNRVNHHSISPGQNTDYS